MPPGGGEDEDENDFCMSSMSASSTDLASPRKEAVEASKPTPPPKPPKPMGLGAKAPPKVNVSASSDFGDSPYTDQSPFGDDRGVSDQSIEVEPMVAYPDG